MPMIDNKLVTLRRRPSPLHTYMFFELLDELIKDESLDYFLETKRSDLIIFHHSLGRYIRNTYIYSGHNPCTFDKSGEFMDEYEGEHVDDVSFEMIESLHDHMTSLISSGTDLYEMNENRKKEKK